MSANGMESCSAEEVTEGREELRPGRGSGGLGRGGGAWSEEWSRLNLTPNKHLQSPARPLVSRPALRLVCNVGSRLCSLWTQRSRLLGEV